MSGTRSPIAIAPFALALLAAGCDAGNILPGDVEADASIPQLVDASTPNDADASSTNRSDASDASPINHTDADITPPGTLAPTGDAAQNAPVDGIECQTSEQLLFHIHAHLAIYVNGTQKLLPAGVGIGAPLVYDDTGFVIGGSCFSWLHTHDQSGIIHIESPIQRTYTLGNFFDVWGQPLNGNQVGPAIGKVSAFLNGAAFNSDITTIPLDDHNVIQLDVGTPEIPAQAYTFPMGY